MAEAVVPFGTAAHPTYFEGPWADISPATAAATVTQVLSGVNNNVPQYGFLIAIWIWAVGSGGTLGAGAASTDYPFSGIAPGLKLTAPNGAEIFGGANWGGYETYLANRA